MAILVLGLGNTIMTDDGFGVRVIEALASRYRFPEEVRLLDGGTLGLDLLPYLEATEYLLIVDALEMHADPGTVFRLEGGEVPRAFAGRLSVHQLGVQELLAVAEQRGHLPRELVVWGVQPERIEIGAGLTTTAVAAIDQVVAGVVEELRRWGAAAECTAGNRCTAR